MKVAGLIGIGVLVGSLLAGDRAAPDVTVWVDGGYVRTFAAKDLARRMLTAAGVRVAWRTGTPKPNAADGLIVSVKFVEAPSYDYQRGVLARAFPFGCGVHGVIVFQNRLEAIAETTGLEDYKLMAHVLVHEITRVLEGTNSHSASEVMKAHWTLADYHAMAREPLPFAQEDIEWIHRILGE